MAINFSDTLLITKECFKDLPLAQKIKSVTIIRDVYGYIRVLLEPMENDKVEEAELFSLQSVLKDKLGKYYKEDIWTIEGKSDGHRSLVKTIENERVPANWDNEEELPRWYVLERHIAKKTWASGQSGNRPWKQELVDHGYKPPVVAFFSFKGGVGRTTSLAATALTLASYGYRAAMVDLDLEAPGLASYFFKSLFA